MSARHLEIDDEMSCGTSTMASRSQDMLNNGIAKQILEYLWSADGMKVFSVGWKQIVEILDPGER